MKNLMMSFLVLFVGGLSVSAQSSVSAQLGGAEIQLRITSGPTIVLNESVQYIVPRAIWNSDYSPVNGYGYGYGYEAFHLEFLAMAEIQKAKQQKLKSLYRIQFYGKNDELLLSREYRFIRYLKLEDNSSPYKYACSIGLSGIPMPLFDQLTRIDITEL